MQQYKYFILLVAAAELMSIKQDAAKNKPV
jgi:hypothetical protein